MFKRNALANSTKSTYRCQLNAFLRFCFYFDKEHLPVHQDTLRCYVAYLARTLNPSSIGGYLNVVRIIHLDAGLPNPLLGNWEVAMIRRGISRKLGRPPRQKLPITLEILRKLFVLMDFSRPSDISFWAACLVCFFGLLRKNTLLPASMSSISPAFLVRSDVVGISSSSFLLRIRHTKTIQFGQRILTIPFVACIDIRVCPVTSLLRHLVMSPLKDSSPLFNFLEGGRLVAWTHATFVSRLKSCLAKIGISPESYSGHSFRRGGCSLCFEAGLGVTDIKLRGDWRSQSFERYLFVPAASVFRSAVALSSFAGQ